ncbi:MAG: fructose-bisphosphate aldolase class I [Alphaproteobacteria bacterium]|nr:fructose-bisphosphate aldolase class I [Alphaproteobacteria bacterium]
MSQDTLKLILEKIFTPNKGILAADESTKSINAHFARLGIPQTTEYHQKYRDMLLETPELNKYISGVILYDETFYQKNSAGVPFVASLKEKNIVVGIKVDEGLFKEENGEESTLGIKNLKERLKKYKDHGAEFTKWRSVYKITSETPTKDHIKNTTQLFARYAKEVIASGMVPICEPEILIQGKHSQEETAQVFAAIMLYLIQAFKEHEVSLSSCILKTGFIVPADNAPLSYEATAEEVGEKTHDIFSSCIPHLIGGVVFLSGGLTTQQATSYLRAYCLLDNKETNYPETFSFGRGLQREAIQAWGGEDKNIALARQFLLKNCRHNSLALDRIESHAFVTPFQE